MCLYQSDKSVNGIKYKCHYFNEIMDSDKRKLEEKAPLSQCNTFLYWFYRQRLSKCLETWDAKWMSHTVKTTTTTTRQTTVSISSFRNIESGWSVKTHSIKSICENHPIDCCWLQIDIDSRAKSLTLIAFRVFRYATLSLRLLWFRFVGRFVQTSPFTVAAPAAAAPWNASYVRDSFDSASFRNFPNCRRMYQFKK